MKKFFYRWLLFLHPAPFRSRFAAEMLCDFDDARRFGVPLPLVADAAVSLARQWLVRSAIWRWALAVALGMLPLVLAFGSFLLPDRPMNW
jgi:hypothetical protein